jgi:hypothetical protein
VIIRPNASTVSPVRHHQRPDDRAGGGQAESRIADQGVEAVRDPAAEVAAVPAGPDDRAEERAQRDEPEPDQLGMVVSARLAAALLAPDSRGHARLERASLPTARHRAHASTQLRRSLRRG